MKREQILYIVVFVLAAVFILQLGNVITGYGDVDTNVTIPNEAPTVASVLLHDGQGVADTELDMSAGSTKTVTCWGIITDTNGYDDIISANGTIYSTASTYGGADDYNEHYYDSSCTLTGGYDTTKKNATCEFTVYYFADSDTWTCDLWATDNSSAGGMAQDTATLNSLIALDTDAELEFGTLATSATTAQYEDVNHTIRNFGNEIIDVQLNGTDMACSTLGTITKDYIKYGLTYGTAYGNLTSLTASPVTQTAFDLAIKTSQGLPEYSTDATHWMINIPAGVKGTCTGTIQFTAIAGA